MKVILFNGPPGVGKDTAARVVQKPIRDYYKRWNAVEHFKMAEPLKKGVHAIFNLFYSPEHYDAYPDEKNAKHELLFGMSPREAYIWMHKVLAKKFGDDIVARLMLNKLHNTRDVKCVLLSDGGILEEQRVIVNYVKPHNYKIIEIRSPDHTFEGDSRKYLGEALKKEFPNIHYEKVWNLHGGTDELRLFNEMVTASVMKFIEDRD
jgi:hypothetical protein